MSDSDSFINEVSEELRRDRMFALWRRYGPWAIGGVAALVLVAAIAQWRASQEVAQAEAAGAALIEAAEQADPQARAAAFDALAQGAEPGPALVARLSEAAALAQATQAEQAAQALDAIAADEGADPLYRQLAAFKAVIVRAPEMSPQARIEALAPHAAEGAPFRLLALEQRAVAHLSAGDRAAARADIDAALTDPLLTATLADRMQRLAALAGASEAGPDIGPDAGAEIGE